MKVLCAWLVVAFPVLSICPDRLEESLKSQWLEPSARLGVVVRTQAGVLVDIRGGEAFVPASVQKLFTTAAALTTLGADFRVRTTLTMSERGELELRAGGDPGLSSERDLPKLLAPLKPGPVPVTSIRVAERPWGNIYGRGWSWSDIQAPFAPPIGLVIDENILEWRVDPQFSWQHPSRATGWQVNNHTRLGQEDTLQIQAQGQTLTLRGTIPAPIEYAVPIPDPQAQIIKLLSQKLQGVGGLRAGEGVVYSAPLRELIKTTNKDSNNLYAEQLFRILGKQNHRPGSDYEVRGREIVTQRFGSLGFHAADGSGLSRFNQATPHQIADLLLKMAGDQDFRRSLASRDGTLARRLTDLEIQAKTGTLTGVAALAGYLDPPRHPPVVFAILINHSLRPAPQNRATIDAMVAQINQLTPCEPLPQRF